ncbi:glycosyltransferase family 2 protein [Candidatus Daviesbacteria bacterium]|nr:glycosyltransferase family 2 protein [Candidatus Daviesbacteria bacterium]
MKHTLDLSISLISFNNKDLLVQCLNSIYKNNNELSFEILLVDNGSLDGSPEIVRQKFPKVKLIANKRNLYFIKAHNQNLKKVTGRYFLILNEDTRIPPGVLKKMVKFMDQNPKIGAASLRQKDEAGRVDLTCSRFPTPWVELLETSFPCKLLNKYVLYPFTNSILSKYRYKGWKRDTIKEVDVIPGSFFLGRSGLLKTVGLLDEKLIFFYVEPDYCQRVKKMGYLVVHNGKLTIIHLKSKGISNLTPLKRYWLMEQGILNYYKKYFGTFWWYIIWLFLRPNWLYWHLQFKK